MTARACAPDPPCDCLTVTACPVWSRQCFANARSNSAYSSRVGSYETLSKSTALGAVPESTPVDSLPPPQPNATMAPSSDTASGKALRMPKRSSRRVESEVQLRAKRETVLGRSRSARIVVKHCSFEIQRVPKVPGRIPAEPHSIAVSFLARPGGGEAEREGAIIDLQGLVPRSNLERPPP